MGLKEYACFSRVSALYWMIFNGPTTDTYEVKWDDFGLSGQEKGVQPELPGDGVG
jgi:hypothetical protein